MTISQKFLVLIQPDDLAEDEVEVVLVDVEEVVVKLPQKAAVQKAVVKENQAVHHLVVEEVVVEAVEVEVDQLVLLAEEVLGQKVQQAVKKLNHGQLVKLVH